MNILTDIIYRDHNSTLPSKSLTGEIDHVILAFVQSSMLYNESTIVKWWDLPKIKSHFKENTTFMVSIGGDPDFKQGFHKAVQSDESRKSYARKVANFVKREGFDGVGMSGHLAPGTDYMLMNLQTLIGNILAASLKTRLLKSGASPLFFRRSERRLAKI